MRACDRFLSRCESPLLPVTAAVVVLYTGAVRAGWDEDILVLMKSPPKLSSTAWMFKRACHNIHSLTRDSRHLRLPRSPSIFYHAISPIPTLSPALPTPTPLSPHQNPLPIPQIKHTDCTLANWIISAGNGPLAGLRLTLRPCIMNLETPQVS